MKPTNGSRYEIAIDGTPRTYRDREDLARAAAILLKTNQPNAEITVRNLQTDTMTKIERPLDR